MSGTVALDGDESTVRTVRAVLAGRGYRIVELGAAPAGGKRSVVARRVRSTAFDGYEVLVVREGGTRKVWTALTAPGSGPRRSEALLALVLLEFLEAFIDPSPTPPPPRRRRHAGRARHHARSA